MASRPPDSTAGGPSSRMQSLRPASRSAARSTSTATLSRATSSFALTPASRLPTTQPLRSSPRVLSGGTTALPLPKSRLPATKSAATLRQPPSQLSLRPSRLAQPSTGHLNLRQAGEPSGPISRPAIRRVPSTNFKENFFAPPPSAAPALPPRTERKVLTKRKSQLLPTRRPVLSSIILARGHPGGAEKPSDVPHKAHQSRSISPLPRTPASGLVLTKRAPTPSAPPTNPPPPAALATTQRTIRRLPSTLLPASPLPAHLGSSPWKGPRTSIDQIKDTEYSFTEEDSIEIPSGPGVSRFDPGGTSDSGRWLAVSTASRPASRAAGVSQKGTGDVDEALEAKEREIELLKQELRVERQMLGRLRREEADREEERQTAYEAERAEMARKVARLQRDRAADKWRTVVKGTEEMQRDIDAAREVIRRLRAVL